MKITREKHLDALKKQGVKVQYKKYSTTSSYEAICNALWDWNSQNNLISIEVAMSAVWTNYLYYLFLTM